MNKQNEVVTVGAVYDGWTFEKPNTEQDIVWLGPPGADNYAYKRTNESLKGRQVWQYDEKLSNEKQRAMQKPALVLPPSANPTPPASEGRITIKRNEAKNRWEMVRGAELLAARTHLATKEEMRAWITEVTGLEARKK